MIKIAYYFSGNTSYVKELSKYDLTVIINDEKYIDELLKYNVHIKMLKYAKDYYDILVVKKIVILSLFGMKSQ